MKTLGRLLYWVAPLAFCLALYWLGLKTWFSEDDFAWLGLRLQVHDWNSFVDAMFTPMAQGTIRPWSERGFFMLMTYLFGIHALPFRIWIFANQCLNVFLVMLVTRRLTESSLAAFIAPFFWLVNVSLVRPMTWSSSYNEVLCSTFLLGSTYLFIRYVKSGDLRFYWAQWATFILGFGALELNFVYPCIAALYAFMFSRRHLPATLPMAVASAIYVIADRCVAGHVAAGTYYYDLSFAAPALWKTFTAYWKIMLGFTAFSNWSNWPHWLIFVCIALITGSLAMFVLRQARQKDYAPAFASGWFFIVLTPLLPMYHHVTDYYLTVPSIGIAMVGAIGISSAWQRGRLIAVAASAVAALYFLPSADTLCREMTYFYERGENARTLVQSVAYAKSIHPGKAVLLQNIDDDTFWASIYHSPFRIFGWHDVFVLDDCRSAIRRLPQMKDFDRQFIPRYAAFSFLDQGAAVVYRREGQQYRNVTQSYTLAAESQPLPALDRSIDLGNQTYSDQIGAGWYGQEKGFRWSQKRAVVYLPAPRDKNEKLRVHGFVTPDVVKDAPIHLTLKIDGHAAAMKTIQAPMNEFAFVCDVPCELIGRTRMEVGVDVDRTTRPKGDGRELGLAFDSFAIQ